MSLVGLVSPPELSALYALSRLLAYVPVIEGFGLPPVEAMAFGTPVVASPLPSTAGAAYEVDPHDTDSIAEGLLRVATDEDERTRLTALGFARSAELSWKVIARRHLAVWDEARRSSASAGSGWLNPNAGRLNPCDSRSMSPPCRPDRSGRVSTPCPWPGPWRSGPTSTWCCSAGVLT